MTDSVQELLSENLTEKKILKLGIEHIKETLDRMEEGIEKHIVKCDTRFCKIEGEVQVLRDYKTGSKGFILGVSGFVAFVSSMLTILGSKLIGG